MVYAPLKVYTIFVILAKDFDVIRLNINFAYLIFKNN